MNKLWLLCCLGGISFMTSAQQPRLPENYYWQKFDNGLEVVVIENHKVPLATIEIAVKNGAYTEGPEYSGLSHLFEHMFFKANKDYPDQEKFIRRTQELGMIWNGTTGGERVNYFFTFDKDSLEAGLKFMNAAMRFPIYRAEDMRKERPVVDGEFQRGESDPGFQLWLDVNKRCWGDLFTRKNPIGDHDIINTATPEKMIVIKDKYYYPNNSILVICGDVKPAEAFAKAKAIYGDWKASDFNPHEKYPIPEFKPLEKTDYNIKISSIAQTPYIMLQWEGPDYRNDSAATLAADVLSAVLDLNSSQWQQALIDKGLATFVNLNYLTAKYVGPISVFAVPNPSKMKEFYAELQNQLNKMADANYITDEQLATAKANLLRNKIRQDEKPSNLPHSLTFWWCSTSLDYFTDYNANMQKVTREQIASYVKKYIAGKPYIAGMIINEEMDKQLKPEEYFTNTKKSF
ncbi:MAG TPA: pitrilysin family protein [Chitinophagaceae bacterium]|jgi:zinc protease|nr:pitrilysin family protein [Chitinophagaceae bacterium]